MIHFKKYGVLYAILFVFTMWLLTPSLVNLFAPTGADQIASRGQFGDMYGYVTSLFSGLTIIGLVYTIIQQHEDLRIARESLKEQKNELQQNRQELIETRKEFATQNKTLLLQRFENTFFKMLDLQTSITNELNYPHRDVDGSIVTESTGKDVIRFEREALVEVLGKEAGESFDELEKKYEAYDQSNHTQFDRYLSGLDSIQSYIIDSEFLSAKEKTFYFDIFALQLNDHELAYFFYYECLFLGRKHDQVPQSDLTIARYVNPIFLGNHDHIRHYSIS